jgi:transcription elongation factor GreA
MKRNTTMNNAFSMSFNIDQSDKYATNENYNELKELSVSGDVITERGKEVLQEKIVRLQKKKPEISEQIKNAREQGGLEENEELHMALEEMQRVEMEISRLYDIMENATVLPKMPKQDYPVVRVGMTVRVLNSNVDKVFDYTILGEVESDPSNGIISYKSPLGKELLGAKVGDFIDLERGSDFIEYEVLKIYVK